MSIYFSINYSNDINVSFENDSSIREIISSFFFFFEKFKSDTLVSVKKTAKREVSLNNLVLHFSILFLFLFKIIGKE